MMTWDVTDLGFRMGLSQRVPDVLDGYVAGLVDGLLGRHGLTRSDVDGWAVHPGGPRILDVVRDRLELPAEALDAVPPGTGRARQLLVPDGTDDRRCDAVRDGHGTSWRWRSVRA